MTRTRSYTSRASRRWEDQQSAVREGTGSDCVPGLLQPNSRSIVGVERKNQIECGAALAEAPGWSR
jgi:hypothetical protein